MTSHRLDRINELLKRELATALFHDIHQTDFEPARVTITRVITSADLQHARVFVSVIGDDEQRQHMMAIVRQHRRELQGRLGRHVRMKCTPRLIFEDDHSLEEGDRVLNLLESLHIEDEPRMEEHDDAPESPQ